MVKKRIIMPALLLMAALLGLISCAPAAPAGDDFTVVAVMPLENAELYDAKRADAELPEADTSDIAEILAEYRTDDGGRVLFYRSHAGEKYCAYQPTGSDRLYQLTQEVNFYEEGYAIVPFTDVLGHDGFRIGCPRGAAYYALDYYYFDDTGMPRMLAACANYVLEEDFDQDGQRELLWFYHGREPYYYFRQQGDIYMAYVEAMLQEALPEWVIGGVQPYDLIEGRLPFHYMIKNDDRFTLHNAWFRFTADAIEVLVPADTPLPGAESGDELVTPGIITDLMDSKGLLEHQVDALMDMGYLPFEIEPMSLEEVNAILTRDLNNEEKARYYASLSDPLVYVDGEGIIDFGVSLDAVDATSELGIYDLSRSERLSFERQINYQRIYSLTPSGFKTNSEKITVTNSMPEHAVTVHLFYTDDVETPLMQFSLEPQETKSFTNLTAAMYYSLGVSTDIADPIYVRLDISD
ncbi:MAG: hypothetical protein Q4B48_02445 [Syntrophomonadaceae bacterium]|nr:hypothetical protein [Syntrophomonadaceae bacterium]